MRVLTVIALLVLGGGVALAASPPARHAGGTAVLQTTTPGHRVIRALSVRGQPRPVRVLVVGCIHGDECEGMKVVRLLMRNPGTASVDLWVIPDLNPDGRALGRRTNGRGVDLNRNFPAGWRARGRRGDPEYAGPRPLSERESRFARSVIRRLRPAVTVWFHQPQAIVRAWGRSQALARRYAGVAQVPYRAIRWPAGTAPRWQNTRLRAPSFVVELPAGPLSAAAAERHARAVRALAAAVSR